MSKKLGDNSNPAREGDSNRTNSRDAMNASSLIKHADPTQIINAVYYHLKKHHDLDDKEITEFFLLNFTGKNEQLEEEREVREEKVEFQIPVSIFSAELGSLESIVKYLNENLNLKNKKISELLNRSVRTIWNTYANAARKQPKKIIVDSDFDSDVLTGVHSDVQFFIPISKLRDRTFSTLEIIVMHLREAYNLSLHEIAVMLKRDDSTIWTVYSRAVKKQKSQEAEKPQERKQKTKTK